MIKIENITKCHDSKILKASKDKNSFKNATAEKKT